MTLTQQQKDELDQRGFIVLNEAIPVDLLDQLHHRIEELFTLEGEQAGAEFKQEAGCRRLANLADKGEVFHQSICFPILLEAVRHVLGPEFKISSVNARSVSPHSAIMQPLHADMGALPDVRGNWVCNSVWMMTDFTPENGAIRLIPGSHRWGKLPQEELADPTAAHPDEILLTGKSGTIVVMNAHLWHGGTPNRTGLWRTALHVFFVRRDKPQQQYQKKLLRPETQETLSAELRWLLALDDPMNDEVSQADAYRSGFLK